MTKNKITKNNNKEVGRIVSFFSGVAKVEGIPHTFLGEVLLNKNEEEIGIVIGFAQNLAEVLFFSEDIDLDSIVFRSGRIFSVHVSENIIGRILNGRGVALDQLGTLIGEKKNVFNKAPGIIERSPVKRSLFTGIKIIDTTLPLGRGQRELIIGDRKLGKTTLAVDVVLNQKYSPRPVYCVYVLIGQKKQKIDNLLNILRKNGALDYSVVVMASANDSLAEQYLAPLIGCTLGEFFRDIGQDALVVYDDFSRHAMIYRDIALLLERPPGREAYPGDIFSLHAGILERAAQLSSEKGGGSLSALPIIETQEGDITSFIATNLISITDGQIYLENGLFQNGFLPAVNVGLSVSRIGSQVQPKLLREVVGGIRLAIAQHKEMKKLTRLETVFTEDIKQKIQKGDLILELLKQNRHTFVSWPEQLVLFYVVEQGLFNGLEKEQWEEVEKILLTLLRNKFQDVIHLLEGGILNNEVKKKIKELVDTVKT